MSLASKCQESPQNTGNMSFSSFNIRCSGNTTASSYLGSQNLPSANAVGKKMHLG